MSYSSYSWFFFLLQLRTVSTATKRKHGSSCSPVEGPTASGNNTLTRIRPFVDLSHEHESVGAKQISFREQGEPLVGNETVKETKRFDSEMLAKNRGNAMLRYREKRKTRRHGSILLHFTYMRL